LNPAFCSAFGRIIAVQAYRAEIRPAPSARDRLATQLANQALEAFTRIHQSVQPFIDSSTTMASADFSVGIVATSRMR
jgi:hypothetical protein